MVWMGYQKPYDSVPHPWILHCLKMFGVASNVCPFMTQAMVLWHTRLICGDQYLGIVNIQCGIFRVTAFLLYCSLCICYH